METRAITDIGSLIGGNPYVGRGLITGLTADGKNAVCAYFIMGRSANSRNRIFSRRADGAIITEPYDAAKVSDPSLIIYTAVRECNGRLIATNGDQTDTVADYLRAGLAFEQALLTRKYEPDAPNYTPRISSVSDFRREYSYKLSILKCADGMGGGCDRFTFDCAPVPGTGHFIHTYSGDGDPLPSFAGEPEKIRVDGDIDAFAGEVWAALNEQNRISLYVRYTRLSDRSVTERIINKYN